jgi:hypothetical protein
MILNFCQLQFTTKFGAREALAHPRGNRVRALRELFRFDGFGFGM